MKIWKDITEYEGFYQVSNYGNNRLTIDKKEYHFKTLQEAITKRDEILKAVMK